MLKLLKIHCILKYLIKYVRGLKALGATIMLRDETDNIESDQHLHGFPM